MERRTLILLAAGAGILVLSALIAFAALSAFSGCVGCLPLTGEFTRDGSTSTLALYSGGGCYRDGCGTQWVTMDDIRALEIAVIPEGPGAGAGTVRVVPGDVVRRSRTIALNDTITGAWRTRLVATVVYRDGERRPVAMAGFGPDPAPQEIFYHGYDSPRFVLPSAGGDTAGVVKEKGAYFPDEGFGWGCWLILYTNGTGLYRSYNLNIDKTVPEPGKRRVLATEPAGNITVSSLSTGRLLWAHNGSDILVDFGPETRRYHVTRDASGAITSVTEAMQKPAASPWLPF